MYKIENEIKELVKEIINLPTADKNNVIMYAENKEYGVAIDTLCNQLYEYNINISISIFNKIENIAKEMDIPISTWDFLKEIIK